MLSKELRPEQTSRRSETTAWLLALVVAIAMAFRKQIDGIILGLKADPVQIIGDIQPTEKEELILSEPKKLTLKGNVPSLAAESKKNQDKT